MRKPRELQQGATYHVICRINRREMVLSPSTIKELFLQVVRKGKSRYSFAIQNFCIMGNHVHFILKPAEGENLSRIMQWILAVFAIRFNRMFKLTGHVWYDRFLSKIISNMRQYIATFIYICMNPVKAELVKNAVDYKYCGIYQIQKGIHDILERPPNEILKTCWPLI